jgi:DNA-3-methyladenine glycosylase II
VNISNVAINGYVAAERFVLPVVPPFRLDFTVWALRRRKKNIIDQWDRSKYVRIIVFNNNPVKMSIVQEGTINDPKLVAVLQGKKRGSSVRAQKEAHLLIQKMLGLDVNLQPFYTLAKNNNDEALMSLGKRFLGVKPPRFPTVFEALINAIACQQVTLDLGILMLNRLSENFGLAFNDGGKVLYAFPRPQDLSDASEEDIKRLGFSYQKARAIKELAVTVANGGVELATLEEMTNKEAIEYLLTLRGIGRWSAEYVLLRGLGRVNTFPGDDIGAQNNLKRLFHLDRRLEYLEIKKLTSRWHPFEGLVYFHLLLDKLQTRGII